MAFYEEFCNQIGEVLIPIFPFLMVALAVLVWAGCSYIRDVLWQWRHDRIRSTDRETKKKEHQ